MFSKNVEESTEKEQISQGFAIPQSLLTKKQIENNNNYLYIQCSTSNWVYKLNIISYDIIEINFNTKCWNYSKKTKTS